jgi:hypothetical protein
MSQIINKSNHLKKELFMEYGKIIVCLFASIFCIPLAFYTYGFSLIGTLVFGVYIKKIRTNISILSFGLKGEKEVLKLLSDLPKRYKVVSDILIQGRNTSSQIDYVIIGSNGIFIVEAKNIKGNIKGKETDKYLTQIKIGKGGKEYIKEMYNPTFQVKGHVIGLTKLLKKNKLPSIVQGVVYFANEDCNVEFNSSKIAMLTKKDNNLLKYIKTYKNEEIQLTPKEQMQITELLKKHIM